MIRIKHEKINNYQTVHTNTANSKSVWRRGGTADESTKEYIIKSRSRPQ